MHRTVDIIALLIVIAGAINWTLAGLFDMNLIAEFFGLGMVADAVYILVGVAGVYVGYYTYKQVNP